jgi:hypothetical protein
MPDFTSEIEIYVDEFWDECSRTEKDELIDILEESGWVKRIKPKGGSLKESLPSILEIEWQEICNKLSDIRQRISSEDEETIKDILLKY